MKAFNLTPSFPKFIWDVGELINDYIRTAKREEYIRIHHMVCKRCKKRLPIKIEEAR